MFLSGLLMRQANACVASAFRAGGCADEHPAAHQGVCLNTAKTVVEDGIPPHDPSIYAHAGTAATVDGWCIDDSAVIQWRRDGYLLIKGGYTAEEVDASVKELQGLMLSDNPAVHTVYYEGMLRKLLTPREGDSCDTTERSKPLDGADGSGAPRPPLPTSPQPALLRRRS